VVAAAGYQIAVDRKHVGRQRQPFAHRGAFDGDNYRNWIRTQLIMAMRAAKRAQPTRLDRHTGRQ
jgi:hypothetical protein